MLVYRRVLGFESNEPPVDWRGRPEKKKSRWKENSIRPTVDGTKIPNNHLGWTKPSKLWDKLPTSPGDRRISEASTSYHRCPTGTSLAMPWQQNGQALATFHGFFAIFWQAVDWAAKGQDAGIFQWRKKRYKQLIQAVTYLDSRSLEVTFPIFEFGSLNNPQKVKRIASNNELVQYLLLVACYPIIGYSDPCWFWTLEIRGLKIWPTQTMHTGWVEIPQNYHTFMCVCVCLLSPKKNHGEFKWSFTDFKLEIPCAPNEIWRLLTEKKIIDLYRSLVFFTTSNVIKSLRVNGTVRREVAGRKSIWFVNETVGF